jgi:hypothetical protein
MVDISTVMRYIIDYHDFGHDYFGIFMSRSGTRVFKSPRNYSMKLNKREIQKTFFLWVFPLGRVNGRIWLGDGKSVSR